MFARVFLLFILLYLWYKNKNLFSMGSLTLILTRSVDTLEPTRLKVMGFKNVNRPREAQCQGTHSRGFFLCTTQYRTGLIKCLCGPWEYENEYE